MADHYPMSSLSAHRTVVVADPHPVSRAAVSSLLVHAGAADTTEEAGSSEGALAAVLRSRPDLLITEVDLAGHGHGDGIRLCRRIKGLAHPPRVLVFTGADDPSVVAACLASGADGFVHRSATAERVVRAVETLAAGRPVWYLREQHADGSGTPGTPGSCTRVPGMTAREQQILGLLLGRLSNDEIAAELHLARQTVKNHVSKVLTKAGVSSRRELLAPRIPA
ncbi:response regulator transcription factor [Streptomyces sp. NPDC050738]|uniref:response regulator transcription factor n=1 Tax=Streptomyces sp. NPDC050738 TaxID=3154744 RepID=UPI00341DB94D